MKEIPKNQNDDDDNNNKMKNTKKFKIKAAWLRSNEEEKKQ